MGLHNRDPLNRVFVAQVRLECMWSKDRAALEAEMWQDDLPLDSINEIKIIIQPLQTWPVEIETAKRHFTEAIPIHKIEKQNAI